MKSLIRSYLNWIIFVRCVQSFAPVFFSRTLSFHSVTPFHVNTNAFANPAVTSTTTGNLSANLGELLYPPAKVKTNGTLKVDSLHCIYYEEYGGRNVSSSISSQSFATSPSIAISLHGGPGAGAFPRHAQFFDPELYDRIILFDQRGCGRSTPRGETFNNTLVHLVHDLEMLRLHLDIEKFDVMLGGSWGSTLALSYAQQYPNRVGSLVLRGICLFREQEIDWLFGKSVQDASSKLCIADYDELSKEWNRLEALTIEEGSTVKSKRHVLHAYYQMLLSNDPVLRAVAAKHWLQWEGVVSSLNVSTVPILKADVDVDSTIVWDPRSREWLLSGDVERRTVISNALVDSLRRWDSKAKPLQRNLHGNNPRVIERISLNDKTKKIVETANVSVAQAKEFIPTQAMLTCYYSVNQESTMGGINILSKERIDRIRHIPCIGIQGAQDLICPLDSALDLHEVWPEMELRIVGNGKHSMYDPPITAQLVKATEQLARQPIDCFE